MSDKSTIKTRTVLNMLNRKKYKNTKAIATEKDHKD